MASLTAYGNGGDRGLLGRLGRPGPGSRPITPGNFGVRLLRGSGREGAGGSARWPGAGGVVVGGCLEPGKGAFVESGK